MGNVARKTVGKQLYKLSVNPIHHSNDPIVAPFSSFQRVLTPKADTNPVNIDSARLALVFANINAKDFKYYFYILSIMVSNDRAVAVSNTEMRNLLREKWIAQVDQAMSRLVAAGLLFKVEGKTGQYLVNPVYAWKGNRFDYLDLSDFETITE